MMKRVLCGIFLVTFFWGCNKTAVVTNTGELLQPVPVNSFTKYTISKGAHYANENTFRLVSGNTMRFQVRFDSSCMYTTTDPANTLDINKLYGFSDCGTAHQQNSARVGWRWNGTAIELHAYCYADGNRIYSSVGTVAIGQTKELAIKAYRSNYIFEYEGYKTIITRHCTDSTINGYQLYPYFGGDETAPHEMHIFIREL